MALRRGGDTIRKPRGGGDLTMMSKRGGNINSRPRRGSVDITGEGEGEIAQEMTTS